MADHVKNGGALMHAFNDASIKARAEGNLAKRDVFDRAVQIVAIRVNGLPFDEVADRVERRLMQESKSRAHSPEVQGYYRDVLAVLNETRHAA